MKPGTAQEALVHQESINQEISLFNGSCTFTNGSIASSCTGRIYLRWMPTPFVRFDLEGDNFPFQLVNGSLIVNGTRLNTVTASRNISFGEPNKKPDLTGIVLGDCRFGQSDGLQKLVFHLSNLPQLFGEGVRVGSRSVLGRMALEALGWSLTLDPVEEIGRFVELLKAEGGYFVTYVGVLRRSDAGSFTWKDAEEILNAFGYLISFSQGNWVTPMLMTGFNGDGAATFQDWQLSRLSPWEVANTWFDHVEPHALREVFPGLLALWKSELWREPIARAIYWLIEANRANTAVESGIILIHAALEIVAWVYFVEDKACEQPKSFDRIGAGGRIRKLCTVMNIPTGLPDHFHELRELCAKLERPDGPAIFVEVRNALVHPSRDSRAAIFESGISSLAEVRDIGSWYLELVLLRLCSFNGKYASRLIRGRWQGHLEQVPWAKDSA